MSKTEYAEGGAKLHHPAQDRVKWGFHLLCLVYLVCDHIHVIFKVELLFICL